MIVYREDLEQLLRTLDAGAQLSGEQAHIVRELVAETLKSEPCPVGLAGMNFITNRR
jgi:hypothetical protein